MAGASVIHHTHGRLRVRLPAAASGRRIEQHLLRHPGVTACRRSPRARSLVIEYEPAEADVSGILEVLASVLGLPADAITDTEPAVPRPLSRMLVRTVRRLNRWTATVTHHHVNLQSLLAFCLVALAVRQIVQRQARELPWSAALWYAYELFRHQAR
jgi:Heavy metal associated domain 2